ncbi:TfoX/Sxy family protein [Conexibacter woesei]|uniref:RNA methyltransferase TrmH, group 3 n=1 Tax=Conexibacter woesei (strain DSM 14684 / CCUG 47730 / CIP 108061 / JCM 11494 / NBRC 100937 / ID131577) TaxID=469383 RepID=D3FDF2_CONWI|nr:TfoX/Sxy family protein [Conexibacter woesei]ADB53544.1 RNA methyltransferase TrmH, group 3 [Conexibacter woesei DSM 14684]
MPADAQLVDRVRAALADAGEISERRMFGGVAFLSSGNMVCAVVGGRLLLRLGTDGTEAALREPHTRPMDFTGRPARGAIFVEPPGCATDPALRAWVERALGFAATLPPKRAGRN